MKNCLLSGLTKWIIRGSSSCCLAILVACTPAKVQLNVVPLPNDMEIKTGFFEVDSAQFANESMDKFITCRIDSAFNRDLGEEGYNLSVSSGTIRLNACTEKGAFYGKQTLKQLLSSRGIPCVEIKDAPRFSYRGLHIDVSRHFFPKEEIIKLLDEMAYYKLNKFHFHLTDNGGWRIQIDKYPRLTSMGAFRTQCEWVEWWDKKDRTYLPEGTPNAYGGYYTKEDIREILAHAEKLHIEVIPEIEFPAHSDEVFIGYPELCCTGKPYTSGEFCAGNERTYTFMENVLTEIIDLFPSEYIHIGGDEARKIAWKTCSKCQTLMEKEGLKDLEELQCYMIARMEAFLTSKGKRMIGWDEVLNNHLAPTSTIISYSGQETASEAANRGYNVVFTPGVALYFDWYQATPETQPRAMIGYSPIKKVYSIYPVAADSITALHNEELIQGKQLKPNSVQWVRPEKMKYVVGVQGCAWTEFMNDEKQLEYMIFPRLLAVAEMAWTQEKKRDWQDFKPRMNAHIPQLQARGINTFTLTDEIELTTRLLKPGKMEVVLDTEKYPVEIRYTLDGTNPTMSSLKYEKPFVIHDSVVVKAAIFREERMVEPILVQKVGVIEEITNYFEYIEPEHWKELNL